MINSRHRILIAWAAAFLPASAGWADAVLDRGLAKMAVAVKKFLDEEGLPKAMIVGDFRGVPRLKASGGIEITRSISAQLEKVGIKVSNNAALQLLGKFKLVEAPAFAEDDFESLALQIEAEILDGNDDELTVLAIDVFGTTALEIAGKDVSVRPNVDGRQRQEELKRQIESPQTTVKGAEIRASSNSPFAVEVLVATGGGKSPRPATIDSRGRAFVKLHQQEEYLVRIHNTASFEAAVSLKIDGIDMFVDATDVPKDSLIIVKPGGRAEIPGWFITRSRSKAFQIGTVADSVAAREGSLAQVGTITATFRACWAPDGKRPADEPGGTPKGGAATKQGRDIEKSYTPVVRDLGAVRDVINVRYDR